MNLQEIEVFMRSMDFTAKELSSYHTEARYHELARPIEYVKYYISEDETTITIDWLESEDSTNAVNIDLKDIKDDDHLIDLINEALDNDKVTHSSGLQPRYQLLKTAFTIDYNNGVTHEIEAPEIMDLDDAKEFAKKEMSYTQESVYILRDGVKVAYSRWYGVSPEDGDDVLKVVADGYYANWEDLG